MNWAQTKTRLNRAMVTSGGRCGVTLWLRTGAKIQGDVTGDVTPSTWTEGEVQLLETSRLGVSTIHYVTYSEIIALSVKL